MRRFIAIINQKGGSSKSTTSILVALALAAAGRRVLAVDCDPQAGMTAFLSPSDVVRSGLFELITSRTLTPVNVNKGGLVLDLLPSDHRLDKVFTTCSPYELKKALSNADYDAIVFDTPPTVQGITRSAAFAADRVIVPANISRAAIAPTLYTIEALSEIEKTGVVYLLGKEPDEGKTGFLAETAREFISKLGSSYGGTIEKSVRIQKAVEDSRKWTDKKMASILAPFMAMTVEA